MVDELTIIMKKKVAGLINFGIVTNYVAQSKAKTLREKECLHTIVCSDFLVNCI